MLTINTLVRVDALMAVGTLVEIDSHAEAGDAYGVEFPAEKGVTYFYWKKDLSVVSGQFLDEDDEVTGGFE